MKIFSFKKVWFCFTSVFIFVLHVPFVFAKNAAVTDKPVEKRVVLSLKNNFDRVKTAGKTSNDYFSSLYDNLHLNFKGLSKQAFDAAMKGFVYLKNVGKIANDRILSIVDYSLPSYKKRLFVIDLKKGKLLFNTYVAHGLNSGREYASQFSNTPESNKSSLGFFVTTTTYSGKNGYSLHLRGLERGINDNANSRDIVVHGAEYVSENYIRSQGYIGRSWGCPAVPMNLHKPIIDQIKNGTCLFIFGKDMNYIKRSSLLKNG